MRDSAAPVVWADRGHLDAPGSGPVAPSLAAWAEGYVADLRADLESAGIDPDGSAAAREQAEDESARAGCRGLLLMLGLGALAVVGAWGVALWLNR